MIANSCCRRTVRARLCVLSAGARRGVLCLGGLRLPCALGRSGWRARKREGDGATPAGRWLIRRAFYRADRMGRPACGLSLSAIRPDWGWCDAPADRNYNRLVRLPYPASAERLWRDDALYDMVLVLGYNDQPRRRGAGSAIFVHIARPDLARPELAPTEGCVALRPAGLRLFLRWLRPGAMLHVGP